MKAVSLRISGGIGLRRWPTRCWCSTSTSKLPTMTMLPSARMLSFAAAELARRHVALHDVHAVLLVEGDAGDFVEADHVVLADQAALAGRIVHEHLGDGRLAAGDQVGIRRNLLEEMALAGSTRAKLDEVVVALDERDHAEEDDALGPFVQGRRLQADRSQQEVLPLGRGEFAARLGIDVQDIRFRHLDRPQARRP